MSQALPVGAALTALLALVPASAPGQTPSRTGVTIRGTGSNVAIERREAVSPKPTETAAVPSSPLEEAVALKAGGASDTVVISYLRGREVELPPVIAAADIKKLKAAGAGRSVAAYLATVAAVDIGETGEGHEAPVSAAPPLAPGDLEVASYGAPYAYPLGGGYGASYLSRFPHRARRVHVLPPVGPMPSRFGRPAFHRFLPSRATFSRLPLAP
jgi:hypothetical protein